MMMMATLVTKTQWKCSPLTFGNFLLAQFQSIHEEDKFEEEENIDCNSVWELNSKGKNTIITTDTLPLRL